MLDFLTPVYFICAGCTSLYAEALSWANANTKHVTTDIKQAESVIVLGCQVTDMAVLNDVEILEDLLRVYPEKSIYISGCLGYRTDIPLPVGVTRLDNLRCDYQVLIDFGLVHWANPFWLQPEEYGDVIKNRFRDDYPLRVGVGCHGTCAFCTIRKTRGKAYELDSLMQMDEAAVAFRTNKDVTLTADSPSMSVLRKWLRLTTLLPDRFLNFKNVEPHVLLALKDDLCCSEACCTLKYVHTPIQNPRADAAKIMNRPALKQEFFDLITRLRDYGVKCATNIIVDYPGLENPTDKEMSGWDVVDWNPYWDGVWNREQAEKRMLKYFPWKNKDRQIEK